MQIQLAQHCYFCFQDRFYVMTEAAVLIKAAQIAQDLRPRLDSFTILIHEGQEIEPLTGAARQIMAALTQIQVGFAITYDERRNNISATVVISQDHAVEIPAALGSTGHSQMLALLKGTRFSVDRKRSWLNETVG